MYIDEDVKRHDDDAEADADKEVEEADFCRLLKCSLECALLLPMIRGFKPVS